MKPQDIGFTDEEVAYIKRICKMFNGKITGCKVGKVIYGEYKYA